MLSPRVWFKKVTCVFFVFIPEKYVLNKVLMIALTVIRINTNIRNGTCITYIHTYTHTHTKSI